MSTDDTWIARNDLQQIHLNALERYESISTPDSMRLCPLPPERMMLTSSRASDVYIIIGGDVSSMWFDLFIAINVTFISFELNLLS